MNRLLQLLLALCFAAAPASTQLPPRPQDEQQHGKLPDGRSQTEAILKSDYEQTLKDATELLRLSEELKADIEKNDRHVLSIATLKKTDDIEKLVKRIRSRMKRF
jgi:hypothetical protein